MKKNVQQLLIFAAVIAAFFWGERQISGYLGKSALAETGLEFVNYYDALAASTASEKPVLLYFTAHWCSACRKLTKAVFSNAELSAWLNRHFVLAKLDYDVAEDRQWFDAYTVRGFPTLLIQQTKPGEEPIISRINTPRAPEQLRQQLQQWISG